MFLGKPRLVVRRPHNYRTLAVLVAIAVIALSIAHWFRLSASQEKLYTDTVSHVEQTASQLAEAVAGETWLLTRYLDFAVQQLASRYLEQDKRAFEALAKEILAAFPPESGMQINVVGSDGYLVWSSLGDGDRGHLYVGDRDYFSVHATPGNPDRLNIGKPVKGKLSGDWYIPFSRPLIRKGRFAGVLMIAVVPDSLSRMIALARQGADDVTAILLQDGSYLARNLDLAKALNSPSPVDSPVIGKHYPERGAFRHVGHVDKILRTYSWIALKDYPLIVKVGIAEAARLEPVLDTRSRDRLQSVLGVGVALLLTTAVVLLLLGFSDREKALLESESRYRSLFENNSAVKLLVDSETGQIVDANAAAVQFYGYARDVLLSMNISEINCLTQKEMQKERQIAQAEHRQYLNCPHRLASREVRHVEDYTGTVQINGRSLQFSIIHDSSIRFELQRRLRQSELLYRTLFRAMAEGVMVVDSEGKVIAWNEAALSILGVDDEGVKNWNTILVDAHGQSLDESDYPNHCAARGEELEHALFGFKRHGNEQAWISVSSRTLDQEGSLDLGAAVVSFSDITRLVEIEESLHLAQSVLNAAMEGVIVTDQRGRIVAVNPAFTEITGYSADEAIGKTPHLLSSGQHDAGFYQAMWRRLNATGRWEGEIINRRKDGSIYVEWLKLSVIADAQNQPRKYVGLFSDITEKKRKDEVVWRQANFDALTGLPNRMLLEDRLNRALAQARRRHIQVALLFIDLDRFKPVNDNFGHAVGDELLRQVGRRLQFALRDEDSVGRLGGDEFVAILPDLRVSDVPTKMAEKIVSVLSEPFRIEDHFIEISCSIGIAIYPRDADTAQELIERSDAAMYAAKDGGRNTWRRA